MDRSARVWDTATGQCTHALGSHAGTVFSAVFTADTLGLYTADEAGEVRAWDLRTKECRGVMKTHFSAVTALALSPGGDVLASAGRDKVVALWDTRTLKQRGTVATDEAIEGVQLLDGTTPLGRAVGAPAADAAADRRKQKKAKAAATGAQPTTVVVTVGEQGALRAWSTSTCRKVFELPVDLGGVEGGVIALHRPRADMLVAATADARLLTYCPKADGDGYSLRMASQLLGDAGEVIDAAFLGGSAASDGTCERVRLAVATNTSIVYTYELCRAERTTEGGADDGGSSAPAYLRCTGSLSGHEDMVLSLASSSAALASGGKDGSLRVWVDDVQTGSSANGGGMRCVAAAAEAHAGYTSALAFSRRQPAAFLISGSTDRTVKVWDLKPVRKVLEAEDPLPEAELKSSAVVAAHEKDINAVAVAPNDSLVASASQDRTVRLWRLPSLVPAGVLRGHRRGVWSVAFSPTDRVVATASGDRTVRLWTVADCVCVRTLEGHTSSVLRVAFATAGTQLLSAGSDGLMKLWDVATGECALTEEAHDDKAWALATGDDGGRFVATGAGDGTLALWEDATDAAAEEAQSKERDALVAEQAMANAAYANDYGTAVDLALKLERPGKLRELLGELVGRGDEGARILHEVARTLGSHERLGTLLRYIRDWNTNARFCHIAQAALMAVVEVRAPEDIMTVPGAPDLLAGIAAYTERHLRRMALLVQRSHLVDYTLRRLGQVDAGELQDAADGEDDEDDGVVVFDNKGNVVRGVDPLAGDQSVAAAKKRRKREKKRKRPGAGVTYGAFDSVAD